MDTPIEWLWMKRGVRIYIIDHNDKESHGQILSRPYQDPFYSTWWIWIKLDDCRDRRFKVATGQLIKEQGDLL
jgi:putative AlgH/UPF0301 family transcriptional regulator